MLLAFGAALCFGAWSVHKVGNHLQYVLPAPAQAVQTEQEEPVRPNAPVLQARKALEETAEEWASTMQAWTLDGLVEQTGIASDTGGMAQARLDLLGPGGLAVRPEYLVNGRLFFEEELETGARVALIDEQLAVAIFRLADAVDRTIIIGGEEYQVIGVIRHRKQVGDGMDYGAVIPLNSIIDQSLQLDAMVVEAIPQPGMGASVSFQAVCGMWQDGGTLIDLGKESMAATLWLRVLLFLMGATAVLRLIAWLNGRVRGYIQHWRQALQRRYAVSMLPELAGVILLFVFGYAAAAALGAGLMNFIIQPVYTFPEWVPAVLVEWQDIADAFWKVWQLPAKLREYRTPELLRLRYFTLLIQGCSAGAGVLLALIDGKKRTSRKENGASSPNE